MKAVSLESWFRWTIISSPINLDMALPTMGETIIVEHLYYCQVVFGLPFKLWKITLLM